MRPRRFRLWWNGHGSSGACLSYAGIPAEQKKPEGPSNGASVALEGRQPSLYVSSQSEGGRCHRFGAEKQKALQASRGNQVAEIDQERVSLRLRTTLREANQSQGFATTISCLIVTPQ